MYSVGVISYSRNWCSVFIEQSIRGINNRSVNPDSCPCCLFLLLMSRHAAPALDLSFFPSFKTILLFIFAAVGGKEF